VHRTGWLAVVAGWGGVAHGRLARCGCPAG